MTKRTYKRTEVIVRTDLLYGVACAHKSLTRTEVERLVRQQEVSGTAGGWRVSRKRRIGDGKHPAPCADFPRSRVHWLLEC